MKIEKINTEQIEIIYREYMKKDISELSNYYKKIIDENSDLNITEKYINEKLTRYVKYLSNEEQEEYKSKKEEFKILASTNTFVEIISGFKKDIENDIMPEFDLIKPRTSVTQKITKYLEMFPEEKEFVLNLLNKYEESLNVKSKELNIIEELDKEIEETEVYKRKHINGKWNFSKNEVQNARVIIKDLFLSELSIEDYCHINIKYSIKNIRNLIIMASNNDTKLSKDINEKLNKRTIVLIKESIEVNYEKLKVNKELEVIDYFMITRLGVFDMLSVLKNNYDGQYRSFENFVRTLKNKYYLFRAVPENLVSKNQEINSGITIKRGFEFTTEEKGLILDFMEDKICMNASFYSLIMDKLANGEEIIDTLTGKTLSLELQKVKELQ